jgi:DNA-directed RNA polymerase subunit K/omega
MEKKTTVTNTITRDISKLSQATGNVYESTMIIAKRANQIAAEIKQDLNHRMEEFTSYADTLEETFENREQIELSRYFERLPKPTLTAVKEFEEGKVYYRKIEENKTNS